MALDEPVPRCLDHALGSANIGSGTVPCRVSVRRWFGMPRFTPFVHAGTSAGGEL